MNRRLKQLLVATVAVKLAALALIYAGFHLVGFSVAAHDGNFVYPIGEPAGLISAFKTWDANHYLYLAEHGYRPYHMSNAFYPLLPLTIRAVSALTFGDTLVAGLVASTLFTLAAVAYLFLLVRRIHDEQTAFRAGLLLLAFPTAFYLGLVYTESLFLALAIGLLYYLKEQRTAPAVLFAFLLPLTRPTGLLVLAPALVASFLVPPRPDLESIPRRLLVPAALVLGYLTYLVIMLATTGDAFAGFDAQRAFLSNSSVSTVLHPLDWFTENFLDTSFTLNGFTTSILNRTFFAFFVVVTLFAFRHLDPVLLTYLLVVGAIPAMTGPLTSYMRYVLVAFPLFVFLARQLGPRSVYFAIVPSAAVQVLFLLAHAANLWIS